MTTTLDIDLNFPAPYELQSEIGLHPARFKLVAAGRRVGKTILATQMAIGGDPENGFTRGLLDGAEVLLSSSTQIQADVFWRYLKDWLAPLLGKKRIVYKNEVDRLIRLGSGQIRVRTGRNPDVLRGFKADTIVFDESAYLDADVWYAVGQPMLIDTNGHALFISTPKRRNWFYHLFLKAQDPSNTDWMAWNFPSHANPFLSKSALDALVSDMPEDMYRQEILAEFLEGQGAVFRYVDAVCTAEKLRASYSGTFVMGVDWAMTNDFTVLTVIDVNTRTMVDYDRFNGVDWELQRGRLKAMADKWNPISIIAESNSIGSPNIEALEREGLPMVRFETTSISKPPLIESLVLALDRREITLLNDPIIKGEMMAYERKVGVSGRSQYSAPEGLHDDCVMSIALAWYGVINGVTTWLPVLA